MKNSKVLQIFPLLLLVAYIFYNEYQKLDDSPSDTIKTRNLQVVDDRGLVRFEVATTDRYTSLAMFDTGGVLRYRASSQSTGTMLSFYDNEERLLATVGEKEGPEFRMYYENGVEASGIFVNERNTDYVAGPMLMFRNASGSRVVTLTADKKENEGSMFILESADGEQKNVLSANNKGSSYSLQKWTDGERGDDEIRLERTEEHSQFIIVNGASGIDMTSNESGESINLGTTDVGGVSIGAGDEGSFVRTDFGEKFTQLGSSEIEDVGGFLTLSGVNNSLFASANAKMADISFIRDSKVRVGIGTYEWGSAISAFDAKEELRARISEADGTSHISTFTESGSHSAGLYQEDSRTKLNFFDGDKLLLTVPTQ